MDLTTLVSLARAAASKHGLPSHLVCAICEQESAWRPLAMRYEPGYRWLWPSATKVTAPAGVSLATERTQQRTSWGLMQVMGATARELGCREPFLSSLCQPELGLEYGCRFLLSLLERFAMGGLSAVISAYNAGHPRLKPASEDGNLDTYVEPVLRRMERYKAS